LGHGIRVEQVVARQANSGVVHEPPVIDKVGAHEVEVLRQDIVIALPRDFRLRRDSDWSTPIT
jgi:hypothetical protein